MGIMLCSYLYVLANNTISYMKVNILVATEWAGLFPSLKYKLSLKRLPFSWNWMDQVTTLTIQDLKYQLWVNLFTNYKFTYSREVDHITYDHMIIIIISCICSTTVLYGCLQWWVVCNVIDGLCL